MIFNTFVAIALMCSVTVTVALYGAGDDVIELNPSNWDKRVMQDDGLWIIEFYAPW